MPAIKIEEIIRVFPQTTLQKVRQEHTARQFPVFTDLRTTEMFVDGESAGKQIVGLFYDQSPRGGMKPGYVLFSENADDREGTADITLATYRSSPTSHKRALPLEDHIVVGEHKYIERGSLSNAINGILTNHQYIPAFTAKIDLSNYPGKRQDCQVFDGVVCNKTYGNGRGVLIKNHDGAYDLFSADSLRIVPATIAEMPEEQREPADCNT